MPSTPEASAALWVATAAARGLKPRKNYILQRKIFPYFPSHRDLTLMITFVAFLMLVGTRRAASIQTRIRECKLRISSSRLAGTLARSVQRSTARADRVAIGSPDCVRRACVSRRRRTHSAQYAGGVETDPGRGSITLCRPALASSVLVLGFGRGRISGARRGSGPLDRLFRCASR